MAMSGLGLLGFDPGPGLIAAGALSMGARRRTIPLFALALIGGTTLWGVVLTLVLGPAIRSIRWLAVAESPWGLGVAAVLAVALAWWGTRSAMRILRGHRGPGDPHLPGDGTGTPETDTKAASRIAQGVGPLLLVALLFVAIVTSDPPFPAGVVLSAHRPLVDVVLGFAVWALVSQSPLAVVAVAILLGVDKPVTDWGMRLTRRWMPFVRLAATLAALGASVVLFAWVGVRLAGA